MRSDVIALIPAAGRATRLSGIPCSKEIYPIGSRPVCRYLLEAMQSAGIAQAYIVLRKGKWDIADCFGSGSSIGMNLTYVVTGATAGAPYTLDRAYPFVSESIIAFGFPDILFDAEYAFDRLLERLERTKADVVLGLFPADRPSVMDMVDVRGEGRVNAIVIQPQETALRFSWELAVWTPSFTEFMHEYLRGDALLSEREVSVGAVIQAAIEAGLVVEGVVVSDAPYLDIGTPEGLERCLERFGTASAATRLMQEAKHQPRPSGVAKF